MSAQRPLSFWCPVRWLLALFLTFVGWQCQVSALEVSSDPLSITTTLGIERTITLKATGVTGTIMYSAAVVSPTLGLIITTSVDGTTLKMTGIGVAGTATILITGVDATATDTHEIPITINPLPSISIVTPTADPLLMTVNGTSAVTVAVTGGTGTLQISAVANPNAAGRTVTVAGTQININAGSITGEFYLELKVTDATQASSSLLRRKVEVANPLVWATQPTGTAMLISTGGTNARQTSLPCAITGGHNNPTTTITLANGSALPSFLSVTRSGSTLDIALKNNPTGLPTVTTSYPLKITINDNKSIIESTFSVVWFVNQPVVSSTTTPPVLAYPLANPGYTGVIGSTIFNDPAGSVAGAPHLIAASGFSTLSITCTRVVSAGPPISSWQVGQDQLLCRSSADIFVNGNELRLGLTTVVATWGFDRDAGRLTINTNWDAAAGGIDLLNKLLATIAYTNPAGNFATEPTLRRRVNLVVRASDVRGTNLSNTGWVRDIAFTSQPPVFEQITVEPGERKALQLSFTPSRTDLICTVNPPGPSAGKVVNAADGVITQFTLAEVIQGSIFYKSVDGSLSADSFTLTVVDGDGVLLSDRVNVPVTISLGSGLTMIGEPIRFMTPVEGATTTWNAVARGPSGTTVTVSVVPWFGESGTVIGVAPEFTSRPLVGLTNIPIVVTWSQLATVVNDDPTTTIRYPSFLRFRVRLSTADADADVTVEQPLVIRVLGTKVLSAPELTGNN